MSLKKLLIYGAFEAKLLLFMPKQASAPELEIREDKIPKIRKEYAIPENFYKKIEQEYISKKDNFALDKKYLNQKDYFVE